ncbi:MAG TPA: hypothetical protein VHB50_19205 [Bryobacteraceae bacterium]|nr:hypothetical protein [Bryobacteraceae bacterium]
MERRMHDVGALTWREVVDRHHSSLVDELTNRLDSEIQDAVSRSVAKERTQAAEQVSRAIEDTRRVVVETLNQLLRRLRDSAAEMAVLQILAEGTAAFARRVVVLSVDNNQVRSIASRGIDEEPFIFDFNGAAAITSAVETQDPVIALASAAELSPSLAAALAREDDSVKAYLFPIVARQETAAIVVAAGLVVPAALELLCGAAGMRIEALRPVPVAAAKNPELVQIAAPAATPARRAWETLTPEEQKLHLQAQRVARVRVAELRLYQADELRKGVFEGNIYGALRGEIDKARTEFLQTFLSQSPTMVDYLHLEILRSLAHEDDRLLGQEYPGPMV